MQLMAFNARNKEIFYFGHAAESRGSQTPLRGQIRRRRGEGGEEDEQIVSTHFCVKPATKTKNIAKQCEQWH